MCGEPSKRGSKQKPSSVKFLNNSLVLSRLFCFALICINCSPNFLMGTLENPNGSYWHKEPFLVLTFKSVHNAQCCVFVFAYWYYTKLIT